MNFITFPVAATNIFPAANSTAGGQLFTEWNVRSREMVSTDPNIDYQVGPSFVHGEKDFYVELLKDSGGAIISSSILSISEGRAVVNGHYVETLVPMTIDLLEANAKLAAEYKPILKGNLAIGIRTFYATEQTVMGSIMVEDEHDMFLGVQLVVLPEDEMITPEMSPKDESKVTADLILAKFVFLNNNVTYIKNLDSKMEYLSSARVSKLNEIVSSKYVTKIGLNSKKLYVFAGKGTNPSEGKDTWEDATDSLIVWDKEPVRTDQKPTYKEAQFVSVSDNVYMVLPHKQVTGMVDDEGNNEYYAPKVLEFPKADYTTNNPGIVTAPYTEQIKRLAVKVSDFRTTLSGKQIYYMDTRTVSTELPQINDAWDNGDYIMVKNDDYLMEGQDSTTSSPATMYIVLPGQVEEVLFIAELPGSASHEPGLPDNVYGVELGFQEWYESGGQQKPETVYPEYYPKFFADDDVMRGVPRDTETGYWYDYFRIRYYLLDESQETQGDYPFIDYFYGVIKSGPRQWSDAVIVTGSVALATESTIGGFYNATEDATDYGYVYLDETGHLRLIDYQLLRSGTLAYQLAEDLTLPSGIDIADTQNYLNEYVNQRIAFPSMTQLSSVPSVIHIYMPLSQTDEGGTIEINGLDSRFNTAVCLHVMGDAGSNVTINIRDCQKFMIDPSIEGTPIINVFRTCLRYDTDVFQYIKTCTRDIDTYGTFTGFRDISLWYEQLNTEDPNLTVNGMTVSELDAQIISTDINYWKELGAMVNDNNYMVALKSITFSGEGDIVGCQVLAANNSTDNILPGDKIVVGEMELPQGITLLYPTACLTRKLKITGTFTNAYYSDENWYVTDTSFTMMTGTYSNAETPETLTGQVAFHSKTSLVPSTIAQTSIEVWEPDTYNIFSGGTIS